ncbi:MAG: RNase adapter RapZ, partial [Acidimicrobiales bacterium]
MSDFVVITGLSGAGRSEAAHHLEDFGWFVIDNVPAALIPKVGELAAAPGANPDRVALVVRSGSFEEEVGPALEALAQHGPVRIVYLDAATDVLVRRYE